MSVQKPTVVRHYWQRADSFQSTARDLSILDAAAHAPAIGLLSVHGSIALADAVLVALGEKDAKLEDHSEAARKLRGWCSAKRVSDSAVKHFEWLLNRKSHFSYDDRYVDNAELLLAKVKMDQFFAWALQAFPDVARLKEADHA